MSKLKIAALTAGALFLAGCAGVIEGNNPASSTPANNSETAVSAQAQDAYVQKYLKEGYQQDRTGVLYRVINEGTGNVVGLNDVAYVNYQGKHLDGKVFDQQLDASHPIRFDLRGLIPGFRIGINKVRGTGGEVEFVIPGPLAYPNGAGDIKPNEPLYFRVKVFSAQAAGN